MCRAWDDSIGGTLDTVYTNFSSLANCGDTYNISCLQAQDISVLAQANQALFDTVHQSGLFPVGPSIDQTWIQTIPVLALNNGKQALPISPWSALLDEG